MWVLNKETIPNRKVTFGTKKTQIECYFPFFNKYILFFNQCVQIMTRVTFVEPFKIATDNMLRHVFSSTSYKIDFDSMQLEYVSNLGIGLTFNHPLYRSYLVTWRAKACVIDTHYVLLLIYWSACRFLFYVIRCWQKLKANIQQSDFRNFNVKRARERERRDSWCYILSEFDQQSKSSVIYIKNVGSIIFRRSQHLQEETVQEILFFNHVMNS